MHYMYNPPTTQLNRFSLLSSVIGFKTIYWGMSRFVRTHIAHVSRLFSFLPCCRRDTFLVSCLLCCQDLNFKLGHGWYLSLVYWLLAQPLEATPKIIPSHFSFFLCIFHIVKKNCITHYHICKEWIKAFLYHLKVFLS